MSALNEKTEEAKMIEADMDINNSSREQLSHIKKKKKKKVKKSKN
jgi:hypothetical protein